MAGTRMRLLAGMGALAVTLGGASFAWACSGQSVVVFGGASGSASGPAGSGVKVSGDRWETKPVEVRWNSATGPKLATDPDSFGGPSFSVTVTIPENAPTGVHTVYFIQYERDPATTDPGGRTSITGTARLPFEVTPAGNDVRYSDEADDVRTRTSSSTNGGDESSTPRQASAGASGGEGQFSTGSGQRTGSATGGEAVGAPSAPSSQSFGNLAPSGATNPTTDRSGAATAQPVPSSSSNSLVSPDRRTAAATAPSGQAVFGGSLAPNASSAGPAAAAEDDSVSPRSATGDVWAGFEPGNGSLVPSLVDGSAGSAGSGSSLAVGVGLLSGGLGMLFAGFGIAEVRRQRALARQG